MSKSFLVNVTEVRWITSPKGFVKPLAVLNKLIKKKGIEFDAVGVPDAKMVSDLKIGKGAQMKINITSEKSINIIGTPKKGKVGIPTRCPECKTEVLLYEEKDLYCPNDTCRAKERTPLIKFVKTCYDSKPVDLMDVYAYLNKFPINKKEVVQANSILSFLQMWENAGAKDTNARDEILKEVHGEKYDVFKDIEEHIAAKLKRGVSNKELWEIASLRGVKSDDIEHLSMLNLTPLSKVDFQSQVSSLRVDKDLMITIALNEGYIKNLYNFFTTAH